MADMSRAVISRALDLFGVARKLRVAATLTAAADHQQYAADLRQQREQQQAQHREVVARRPERAQARPGHQTDRRLDLRVGSALRGSLGVVELALAIAP